MIEYGPESMNMIGLLLGILTAITMLSSGCGSKSSSDQMAPVKKQNIAKSDQPRVLVSKDAIAGTWFGPCVRDLDRDEYFSEETLTLDSDSIRYSTQYFSDGQCTARSFLRELAGNYALDGEKITLKFTTLSLTPQASILASSLNQFGGFCGKTDWKLGELRKFDQVCGYGSERKTSIERFGADELFLGDRRFLLAKKNQDSEG